MLMFELFLYAPAVYCAQAIVACIVHDFRCSMFPKSVMGFVKLTFLPYVVYALIFNRGLIPTVDEYLKRRKD